MTIATETKAKLPPSKHEFAEVIHRLEAGGQCYHSENLMQIIGIQSLCCADGFLLAQPTLYCRASFRSVSFLQILHPKEYLDLHNHYAGDDADLRIWREATAHPELLEFMERVKPSKCPSCCTTGCMTESTWSLLKNVCGRCSGTAGHGLGLLTLSGQ